MSEVVALREGIVIAHPGKPNADVVAMAEKILDCARSGEIVGLAFAAIHFDSSASHAMAGDVGPRQLGGLCCLMTRMANRIDKA